MAAHGEGWQGLNRRTEQFLQDGMQRGKPFPMAPRRSSPMRKITKRAAIIGAATVLGISGAGVAFAAWTASGGGSASAQATTAQGLTVSPATTPASLYPGATADVEIDVTNPNPYPVSISSLAPGTITTGVSGCDGSNITFTAAPAALATPGGPAPASPPLGLPPRGRLVGHRAHPWPWRPLSHATTPSG